MSSFFLHFIVVGYWIIRGCGLERIPLKDELGTYSWQSQTRTWSPTPYTMVFFVFNSMNWDVVVRVVDILNHWTSLFNLSFHKYLDVGCMKFDFKLPFFFQCNMYLNTLSYFVYSVYTCIKLLIKKFKYLLE